MEIRQFNFDFLGKGRIGLVLSGVLVIVSLVAIAVRGLEFGIDFTGGTLVEVSYAEPVELPVVREALQQEGYTGAQVQHFGTATDVLIRLPPLETLSSAELSSNILQTLRAAGQQVQVQRIEYVGPQVGEELAVQGLQAALWVIGGILVYIWFRFSGWQLAVNSVIALLHDVIVTLGFFALFGFEFDLTVLAGVLAVAGYSLNDTIVVFDRIRENFLRMRKGSPKEVMNAAVNQTMSRTVITSGTTLVVAVALYLWGGDVIHNFALALIVGIIAGTYSSVFVAANLALMMGVDKNVFVLPEKEGADLGRP